jgi:hypothetical protein
MKLRAVLLGVIVAAFVLSFPLVAPVSYVRAEDTGGCHAFINGIDVSSYNTPDNALDVDIDEVLNVSVVAPTPFASHKVDMTFMDLFSWTVSKETDTGTETSYSTTVNVKDYANYGEGLYKVTATGVLQNGDKCSTVVFIAVGGKSFATTLAGALSLVAGIGGFVGLLFVVVLIWAGVISGRWFGCLGCSMALPLALILTPIAMVAGGGQGPSSGGGQTTGPDPTPKVPSGSQDASGGGMKFRPRISILAIGFALLSAIGFVVLFQQTAVMYPTITVVVVSLVLGLVVGIVLPTLAATFPRRRK